MRKIKRHPYVEEQDGMMTRCKYCGYSSSHTIHCLDESITKDIPMVKIKINDIEPFNNGHRVWLSYSYEHKDPMFGEVGGCLCLNKKEEYIIYLD